MEQDNNVHDDADEISISIDDVIIKLEQVSKLCKKASQRLHAQTRVTNLTSLKQRLTIMKAFISPPVKLLPPFVDVSQYKGK